MTAASAITVAHVHKSYGSVQAILDLGFVVRKGECYSLLGPNGAGKTSMMKILYGKAVRDKRAETVVDVFGYDPATHSLEIKYLSGVVPQEDNLDQELTVRQNLMIYARFYGLSGASADRRIDELLEFMELSAKKGDRIRELSGGMKRRLIIARALVNDPQLLFLDEPTTGLDPQVRHIIWNRLRALKSSGVTILLTTHYMEEAFQLADNVMIMHQGEAVLEGNPAVLVKQQIEPFVVELFRQGDTGLPGLHPSVRVEEVFGHTYLYSPELSPLEAAVRDLDPGEYHLRQGSLEDVFLKITGRKLSE